MKKSISPVIALILLFIVTVVSVVGFQGWITGYLSDIIAESEGAPQDTFNLKILRVAGEALYVRNENSHNISVNRIEIANMTCSAAPVIYSGVNPINISDCLPTRKGSYDVLLVAEVGTLSERLSFK